MSNRRTLEARIGRSPTTRGFCQRVVNHVSRCCISMDNIMCKKIRFWKILNQRSLRQKHTSLYQVCAGWVLAVFPRRICITETSRFTARLTDTSILHRLRNAAPVYIGLESDVRLRRFSGSSGDQSGPVNITVCC